MGYIVIETAFLRTFHIPSRIRYSLASQSQRDIYILLIYYSTIIVEMLLGFQRSAPPHIYSIVEEIIA